MKPEAQRIAIAEACGWESYTHICCGGATKAWRCKSPTNFTLPPNYLTDLNAMHEAEKLLILPLMQREGAYRNMLHAVGCRELIEKITATAAQRAEAFLRTLNLWTD